jgi:hypothetical protein
LIGQQERARLRAADPHEHVEVGRDRPGFSACRTKGASSVALGAYLDHLPDDGSAELDDGSAQVLREKKLSATAR